MSAPAIPAKSVVMTVPTQSPSPGAFAKSKPTSTQPAAATIITTRIVPSFACSAQRHPFSNGLNGGRCDAFDRKGRHRYALVDALVVPVPFPLTEDELLHLAGRGPRDLAEFHGDRALEVRQVLTAEGDELLRRRPLSRLEGHERLWPLTPEVVRDGDDGALEDGGMGAEGVLDLDGGDVLAAGDDDVLLPISQLDGAVRVHDGEVPRVKPATPKRLRRRRRVVVVALHHDVAAHHHFAHRLPIARHVVHGRVDHPQQVGDYAALSLAGEQPILLLCR